MNATSEKQKIYLIHAGDVSMNPSRDSFERLWPDAQVMNILEGSLASDVRAAGGVTETMMRRFEMIGDYCALAGASAILFSCSAFGAAIEPVKRQQSIPVLTPNEALFEEVLERGGKVALVVTFKPSVDALLTELAAMAAADGKTVDVQAILIDDAFDALLAGNQAEHDRLIVQAASKIRGYDVIVFGQFSMSSAAAAVQALQNVPVLTTPDCAVRKLKRLLTQ